MRYYGRIGFLADEVESEDRSSRYQPLIVEQFYAGEAWSLSASPQNADKTMDDFSISHDISIVADPYALQHFSSIKYLEFMGALWEVRSVKVEYPRLRISCGGIYHGPTPET